MKEQNLPRGGAAEGIGVGLTEEQVLASRRLHGANTLTKRKRKGFFRQYLSSFGDPIIKILMVALAINVIFLFRNSDWMESAGIGRRGVSRHLCLHPFAVRQRVGFYRAPARFGKYRVSVRRAAVSVRCPWASWSWGIWYC